MGACMKSLGESYPELLLSLMSCIKLEEEEGVFDSGSAYVAMSRGAKTEMLVEGSSDFDSAEEIWNKYVKSTKIFHLKS